MGSKPRMPSCPDVASKRWYPALLVVVAKKTQIDGCYEAVGSVNAMPDVES
jgi:hypothetical protein